MSKIAVILTHYEDSHLDKAVQSILNQTCRDFELHIVDDCSPSFAKYDYDLKWKNDKRVNIYRSDINVGTYRLKNAILDKLDCEYVVYQDSDDLSSKNRLEVQSDYLDNAKRIDLLGSAFYTQFADGQMCISRRPTYPKLIYWLGWRNVILHGTCMLRRSILSVLGGFDGTTRIAADDEFFYRFFLIGNARNIQKPLYTRRVVESSLTGSSATGYLSKKRLDYKCEAENRLAELKKMGKKQRLREMINKKNDVEFSLEKIL